MLRLTLAGLLHAPPPPSLCREQCLLRLHALSALLLVAPEQPLSSLPAALAALTEALTTLPPPSWARAAAAFHQQALHHATSQAPRGSPGAPSAPSALPLPALLSTAISLSLLAEAGGMPAAQRGLAASLPLPDLVRAAVHEVRAGCVEKWGCAPPFALPPAAALAAHAAAPLPCVPPLLAHSLRELLKNAAVSTMLRHGVAGLDDAPPISVAVEALKGEGGARLALSVRDAGVGLAPALQPGLFPLFASHWQGGAPPAEEGSDWRYSRNFGSAFWGAGVGLARAQLHARLHGGGLALASSEGGGALATITLECSGQAVFDPHPALREV